MRTRLVDPVTRGDPESPLGWTRKSTHLMAREATQVGHQVSARTVRACSMSRRLQGNRKTKE